jgi:hypothetical protein
LNPRGRSLVEAIPAFVERYTFLKYPQKYEDFDETSGVRFEGGTWNGIAVDRMVFYNTGIMVDTRSSTDDSQKVLEDALTWASSTFGLTYKPEMLQRRAYLSELDVKCDVPFEGLNPHLGELSRKLSDKASSLSGQTLAYQPSAIVLNFDSTFTKAVAGPFRFERLVDIPSGDNKYYTSAPLPTDAHLEFLEEFEAILKS